MQGRLSPISNNLIQSFPWACWENEFAIAADHDWHIMEWTIDHDRFDENPLLTSDGQARVESLSAEYGVGVHSITADFFMQRPFFEAGDSDGEIDRLARVIDACLRLGISQLVIPLVDNASVDSEHKRSQIVERLSDLMSGYTREKLKLAFESDFGPEQLRGFIGLFDELNFSINYDIGNSAALGFDCREELAAYSGYVENVHIKDRKRGGTTVPLGAGDADIHGAIGLLEDGGYEGRYIFQTARQSDHVGALETYRRFVLGEESI